MSMEEACLWAFPVLLGAGFLVLSRWARRRSAELSSPSDKLRHHGFSKELGNGNFVAGMRMLYLGDLGRRQALIANILAAGVIIAVTAVLAAIAIAIFLHWMAS